MAIRKLEHIQKGVLLVHAKDCKRVEKEVVISPGPATYNPSFNLLEDSGFKVNLLNLNIQYSMVPRRGKHEFVSKKPNNEELKKRLDEPQAIDPIPFYDVGKEAPPQFSFPKEERFKDDFFN